MKKMITVLSVAVLVGLPLVFGATFVQAADAVKAADIIKIDQPAEVFKGGKKKKTPTEFTHAKHEKDYKIACIECHHTDDAAKMAAGEKPKSCVAADCHGPVEKVVNGKKMVDAEKAYHNNCKDCHKKGKKGPTKCKDCHPGSSEE
jgi:hypothetical protein